MPTLVVVGRSRARRGAVQAVYQLQVGRQSSAEIRSQFRERPGMDKVDWAYFDRLVDGVACSAEALDEVLTPYLDRPVEQLDPVERAILRLAALELRDFPEVPFRVAINEAVELARTFGAEESHRYINGVLDALSRTLRREEVESSPRPARRSGKPDRRPER